MTMTFCDYIVFPKNSFLRHKTFILFSDCREYNRDLLIMKKWNVVCDMFLDKELNENNQACFIN